MISYTKATLYRKISEIRKNFGIRPEDYPLDLIELCKKYPQLQICYNRFNTPGLKGLSYIGKGSERDVVVLSVEQDKAERNFTLTHEIMHTILHRGESTRKFGCYTTARFTQDPYIEWQANEGAAEFLIPAYIFLKEISEKWLSLHSSHDFVELKEYLSKRFNVTPHVIEIRYEHLKYEIHQFLSGVPYEQIKVISQRRQDALGIHVKSLNTIEDELCLKELGGYHVTIGQ